MRGVAGGESVVIPVSGGEHRFDIDLLARRVESN